MNLLLLSMNRTSTPPRKESTTRIARFPSLNSKDVLTGIIGKGDQP